MGTQAGSAMGPDLALGVALASVPDGGTLAGHVGDEPVLLSRRGQQVFAVGGRCTHYGAPLDAGLVVDGQVRCPWHHARFDLCSGRCLAAPALAPLPVWSVVVDADTVRVGAALPASPAAPARPAIDMPRRIVIVGGGAAGAAAALRLRELGYDGAVSLLSADADAPYDRPNLSKDFLAGSAPAEWMPLQPPERWRELEIDLQLGCEVTTLDPAARELRSADGRRWSYDKLLLATGAEPVRLPLPGFAAPAVHVLRSMTDARRLIGALAGARSVAVIGAGFIGLEAAAALRARDLQLHVVAREPDPMARIVGAELAAQVVDLHRRHGVQFHLQCSPAAYDAAAHSLSLDNGRVIAADAVLVGVGVRPRSALASAAGLQVEQGGVVVDAQLCTSDAHIYAVGDIARFAYRGHYTRIEHWVHAQRQGQCAAANLLGVGQAFADVPFFWSHHYGTDLRYTGHAREFDEARMEGSLAAGELCVRLSHQGVLLAAVTVGRDRLNLELERQLEAAAAG